MKDAERWCNFPLWCSCTAVPFPSLDWFKERLVVTRAVTGSVRVGSSHGELLHNPNLTWTDWAHDSSFRVNSSLQRSYRVFDINTNPTSVKNGWNFGILNRYCSSGNLKCLTWLDLKLSRLGSSGNLTQNYSPKDDGRKSSRVGSGLMDLSKIFSQEGRKRGRRGTPFLIPG